MFNKSKKLKELEAKLYKYSDLSFLDYYYDQYIREYTRAFELAKYEVTHYKHVFNTSSNELITWKETLRVKCPKYEYAHWSCNNIYFKKDDCLILETMFQVISKNNLINHEDENAWDDKNYFDKKTKSKKKEK